ncbi:WXG100-like domain-containing protein, partial [Streptomyces rubiginosohelvolus]
MIFILTGEKLMDADEDLAFESRRPYSGLGRKLDRLSSLIDKSIHDIGESMPDDLASSYAKAMGMLIDDGGKNYLRDFSDQLDKIAEGRRKTSMDIMESKWQVIAEIIRLLIEIAIYLAMSFFTGGASASQIMMAKLRSRFFILTTLSHLLQRLHLAPSLTEAFAEAFTTFAVRLAMMNFAPDGRRPDSIDWSDIGKAAAFGAAAGFFTSVFEKFAKDIVRSFDGNFLKGGPDLDFKGPNWRDTPNVDIKTNGPTPNPNPKPGPDLPDPPKDRPDPNPYGNGPTPTPGPVPVTFRDGPFSFRNNPELWRNSQILRLNLDRPGALAAHYGLKGTADFIAAGAGEVVAEILIKGAFEGDWSSSWTTFFGAGISSRVESSLMGAALNSGAELRHAIDKLRNQPPPTVSGGNGDGTGADGPDRTEGSSRTDSSGGNGPGPGLSSPPPVVQQTTGQSDFTGSQSPPPYVSQDAPPPYLSADPPPYTPGPLPVTAAENALWQQVHQGPADVREQALRDLAALRGSQPPGPAEIGVRDGVHDRLSHVPEVRVVPGGNSPAGQVDTDEVRRALESLGTPVTVDAPIVGEGTGASPVDGATGGAESPVRSPGTGTSGEVGTVGSPGTGTSGEVGTVGSPGTGTSGEVGTVGSPGTGTSGEAGTVDSPGTETSSGPETRDVRGDAPVTADGPGAGAPPLTVVVSEGPPPLAASPEAAELLDGAGVDRAIVLGPPTGSDAAGQPVREAVELTREGPGAPVEVRPLTGPEFAGTPDGGVNTAFPGANVLLPLADALGVPPVMAAAPPPAASTVPPAASAGSPTTSTASPSRSLAQGDIGTAEAPPGEQTQQTTGTQETPEPPAVTESDQADPVAAPSRTESEHRDIDPSSVKVVSGEPAPDPGGLPGPDSKPSVITTTSSTPGPDVKAPLTDSAPEAAPDIKPTVIPTSSAPTTTPTDPPAVSKLAADARPWTETATDLHLESGRGDADTPTPTPGQITIRPADAAHGQPPQTLRDFLPEERWWTFYIDPKNHQAALEAFPDDPGSYYDHDRSPGFQQGMVSAYTQFLGDPATVATPMDSTSYRTMHGLATGHLGRTIGWSGGGATQFPLRGETLADDIFDERIGEQLLVYDTTSRDWSTPLPKPRPVTILTRFMHNNPSLATNYGKNAAPGLVDTLFQQHYARVSDPDADDMAKLASIVRTIRALHVVHPFQDGNLRSNVQILLPKLLLEQGLRPVVPDNMYSLFQGGRSVPQMVDSLIRNGALDTGRPRPPQGETAADVNLESRLDGATDTGDAPATPIATSSSGGDTSMPPPSTAGPSVTTLDRKTVPFSELRRFVPQTTTAPQPGVAVQTVTISQSPAEDGTARGSGREALLGQDSFRGVRTTSAEPSPPGTSEAPPAPRTVFTGPPTALPGSGTERGADYFVGHGTPRTVTLGTDNAAYPTVKVSGVQLGEVLKSWAQDGDQDRPLVLFSCETGQQPKIAGLPVAQHVANRTGRPVYAPTTEAGTAKDRDGNVRAVLGEGPDGPGRWRLFTPEPAGTALDDLARDAGLHAGPDPADAFARARTLQQVRTLREVLGPDAEQQSGNRELLAALAYVDGLRWRDPGTAARYGDGRMTPELLDRMVTDWHTAKNGTTVDPATGPTPEQYTAFLEAAAGLRAGATPETTLDALLPPPPPELAPDTLVSQADVLGLSYARSAQITWSLSNAPLPLSELGLGPADTAELARRLHHPELTDPTGPQDAPGPEGSPPPPALPVNALAVDAYTARHTYGIPEKNFDKFRDLARDRNVVVDVRPTNPSAPKWLDAGAMPKPQDIKAKTVNEVDVLLGADAGTIGLVGYFQPVLPDQGSVPHGAWDRVLSRFNQRSTEFRELAGKMAQYEAEGRFVVQDGVVHGVDDAGDRRPITGDHDVFDVSSPDGSRLPHPDHDALIDEMRAKDMAVVHGAHMFWNPPTAFDKSVFDKIVSSHQGPSG